MALPVPNLDDRDFQWLVDEAKLLVQRSCPEWTDHNVSDPGVTLIETFAWMTDQLIYRLNRVPDRNYVKFLELIGVQLFPPTAARADVTFWLTAPQPEVQTIDKGAHVATLRTEADEAIVFATDETLSIIPAAVTHVGSMAKGKAPYRDLLPSMLAKEEAFCFQAKPALGDALLIGLSKSVPSNAVRLRFNCTIQGVGVDPDHPPLAWEASNGSDWAPCEVDTDATGGLNRNGDVVLHVPKDHAVRAVGGAEAAWLRAVVIEPERGFQQYQASPTISRVTSDTIGGTVPAVNASIVRNENLGSAEGVPGQRFQLRQAPILASDRPTVLEVSSGIEPDGTPIWQTWTHVEHFANSGPQDRHFMLDPATGDVRFGPAVRLNDGALRRYGATPDRDRRVRMAEYSTGGGARGNVAAGALRVMKSSYPFVSRVENRREARGGVDAETIENAKERGPIRLRTRGRAVTAEDYEELAREAAPQVGRVKAVAAGEGAAAGWVRVLVVPSVPIDRELEFAELRPDASLLKAIRDHLEERRVLGIQLNVESVRYQGASVETSLKPAEWADPSTVGKAVVASLNRYLSPLAGGPDGRGWPFGRPVTIGELYSVVQRVPGVELVEALELFKVNADNGSKREAMARIEVSAHSLVFGRDHKVAVAGGEAVGA